LTNWARSLRRRAGQAMSNVMREVFKPVAIAWTLGGCGGALGCFLLQPEETVRFPSVFQHRFVGRLL
jgi:hypothetical protein